MADKEKECRMLEFKNAVENLRISQNNLDVVINTLRELENTLVKTGVDAINLRKLLLNTRCNLEHIMLDVEEIRLKATDAYYIGV